jgi:hypothetical protein
LQQSDCKAIQYSMTRTKMRQALLLTVVCLLGGKFRGKDMMRKKKILKES